MADCIDWPLNLPKVYTFARHNVPSKSKYTGIVWVFCYVYLAAGDYSLQAVIWIDHMLMGLGFHVGSDLLILIFVHQTLN